MSTPDTFDYEIRISGYETISIKTLGTFLEAYEVARGYNIYGHTFAFYNTAGDSIVTLTHDQLMNQDLIINYKD